MPVIEHHSNLNANLLAISRSAWNLSRLAVSLCEKEKSDSVGLLKPRSLNWVLALLARLISSARAVTLVIEHGELDAAEMLRRPFDEALANLFFILDGSNKRTEELLDLFMLDYKIDIYTELEMLAAQERKTVKDLVTIQPKYKRRQDDYVRTMSHPVFLLRKELHRVRSELGSKKESIRKLAISGPEDTPDDHCLVRQLARNYLANSELASEARKCRRWRDITMAEKEKSVTDSKEVRRILEHSRMMGSWFIHSSGPALARMLEPVPGRGAVFRSGTVINPSRAFGVWRTVTFGLILGADRVLDAYYLGYELRCRIEALAKRIGELRRPRTSPKN